MSELETIIDQLSDAALLEMVDSDPALLVLQAAALASAAIEARGGKTALQSRLAGAKDLANSSDSDSSATSVPMETGLLPLDFTLAMSSPATELESEPELLPAAPEIASANPTHESASAEVPLAEDVGTASQPTPTVIAPKQPFAEESSPAAATGDDPTPTLPGSVEATVSAADVAEILAAAAAPDEAGAAVVVESATNPAAEVDEAASQPPPTVIAPEQPLAEDSSSAAATGDDPTPTLPGSVEATVSAADVAEILAAAAASDQAGAVDGVESATNPAAEVDDAASQPPPTVAAPEQPLAEDSSPAAATGDDPPPTLPASVDETVSAADVAAILADAGAASDEAGAVDGVESATNRPAEVDEAASQPPPTIAAPEQPLAEDNSSGAATGDDPTASPLASVEETVSAADIDAILAAAGNAPENAGTVDSNVAPSAEPENSASSISEGHRPSVDIGSVRAPEPSSGPSPTLQPASADETASAADIDAILAAAGNAPADDGSSPPSTATHGEIPDDNAARTPSAAAMADLSEGDAPISTTAEETAPPSLAVEDSTIATSGGPAPAAEASNPASSTRCESSRPRTRKSGGRIRTRQFAVTTVGLIAFAVLGVLADQWWFKRQAAPVHARDGRTAQAIAALETCRDLYESTANAMRPRLLRSVSMASHGRETGTEESFIQTLGELRLTHARRIADLQAAYVHAKTEFAELAQVQQVAPALSVDLEKFGEIISRHCEFLGTRPSPEVFEQWYNDYERMTAIYRRLHKELNRGQSVVNPH